MNGEWRLPDSLAATELTPEQRCRAVHTVAGTARDAADLVELLDMLGLSAEEARPRSAAERPAVVQLPEPLRRMQEFAVELAELRKAEAAKHLRRRHQPTASR